MWSHLQCLHVDSGKMCLKVTVLDVKAPLMSIPRDGRALKISFSRLLNWKRPLLEMLLTSSQAWKCFFLSCCCFQQPQVPPTWAWIAHSSASAVLLLLQDYCAWCPFSAASPGAISLLQSDEHPSSSISWYPHLLVTTPALVWMCFGAPLSTLISTLF